MNQEPTKNDIFTSITQSFDEIHNSIEQSTPVYVQSLSNLQQKYFNAWKNFVCSNILTQKEFSEKIRVSAESSGITTQIIQKMTEEMAKGFKLQSIFMKTFLDTSKENIGRISKNSATFAEVNKKFINSVADMWNLKK